MVMGGQNEIMVRGVGMDGTEQKAPVILEMHDDGFPARFLRDVASGGQTSLANGSPVTSGTLYQPVQRILHVAMADLRCTSLMYPRVDPTRVISAGLVIRRCFRRPGVNGAPPYDDPNTLSGWMRSSTGATQWVVLRPDQETLDPDPKLRPQLKSGQPELDAQLAQLSLAAAFTETTSRAFAAPPATCAALNRTVFYAVVPTASSEMSDTQPASPPLVDRAGLVSALPALLRSSQGATVPPVPSAGASVDYRWLSDDFLNVIYPPPTSGTPPIPAMNPSRAAYQFQQFSLALRMLDSVFGAFDGSSQGNQILAVLNRHNVTLATGTQPLGDFYRTAKTVLLDYTGPAANAPSFTMPTAWEGLNNNDESNLLDAMIAALTPRSQNLLAPQGRFQDSTRLYRLRLFFRVKAKNPGCPPLLFWSQYSDPFRIAAWYEGGQRPQPPVPLPDPASIRSMKPNCSFHVPTNLMNSMQGATMSGLMSGGGGGPASGGGGPSLGWICGFSIPLITICAFFVLNIFLSLLNIVFFWLPFIKICIPFPNVSASSPNEGTP
jgi:hypothetical protein